MISGEEDSSSIVSSNEELSESEYEDDPAAAYTGFSAKYMAEITSVLSTCSNVNCENALSLNKEMQQRLIEVRKRLQTLLHAVKQRYISNEQRLKLNLGKKQRGVGMRGAYLKGGTFFFKGNMFFKDLNCRSCPNNQDYEYRKNVEGEIFPMDFALYSRHVWSLLDKKAVVEAVKDQLLDYISDCRSRDKSRKSKDLPLQVQVHSEKLASLLSKVDDKFEIDWEQVSAHNLSYRHSPSSCKTMWLVYLHPSLKRSAWTAEENKNLLLAAQSHKYQNWQSIAKSIAKRSDYQCFIQYQTAVSFNDSKRWGRWDKRDDTKLQDVVQQKTVNGIIDWNAVACYFPHKSKKTLHNHYMYYLNPKISHAPFTAEEDLILLAAVEEYGEKFSLLPRDLFPNRSIAQLRMRYKYTLKNRHAITPWSVDDDKKLMEFVAENGTASWLRCGEMLGNHNRTSCRTRYITIKKFLNKNPNATLEDLPRKKKVGLRRSVITKQNWVEKVAELRENPEAVLAPPSKEIKTAEAKIKKQNAPKLPKCKTKMKVKKVVPYVIRLRAVEQQLYHFLKYAYNFRLGTNVCTKPPNGMICAVAQALDFQVDINQQYKFDTTLPTSYIRKRCKFYLQQQATTESVKKQFGLSLPPSWPTALAFRALCIQSAQLQGQEKETPNDQYNDEKKPSATDVNNHSAVQRFRNRMFALFFQTALLSRLEPQLYTNLKQNTTVVQNNTDTFTIEELTTEDTTLSHEHQQAQQPEFDLSLVKHEFSCPFPSNQHFETIPAVEMVKNESKGEHSEVLNKQKPTKRKVSKTEKETTKKEISKKRRKTEPKKDNKNECVPEIIVQQPTSMLEPNSWCLDNNTPTTNASFENNDCSTINPTVAFQQPSVNTYSIIKQEHTHILVRQEQQPQHTHSHIPSTSSQTAANNFAIQQNEMPQAEQKIKSTTNIKTEFEI